MDINLAVKHEDASSSTVLLDSSGNRDQTYHLDGKKLIWAMIALNFANAVAWLDGLATTVMLPSMGEGLHAQSIVWAGTAALLGAAVGQMLMGYLSDSFGRRHMILSCQALMAILTFATYFVNEEKQLYALRALTAVCTGAVSNLMNIAISDFMPLEMRPKYQGFQGVAVSIGSVVAMLGGGALAASSLNGWKLMYLAVEFPLTLIAFGLCWFCVPSKLSKPSKSEVLAAFKTIDYIGATSLIGALTTGLVLLSQGGRSITWSSPTAIALMVVAALSATIFLVTGFLNRNKSAVAATSRASAGRSEDTEDEDQNSIIEADKPKERTGTGRIRPIVPFRMFLNRTVTVLQVQSLLSGFVYYAFSYFLPVYLQVVRNYSSTMCAVILLPYLLTHGLVSWLSGLAMRVRYGRAKCGDGICRTPGCEHLQRQVSYGPMLRTGFASGTLACGLLILACDRNLHIGWICFFQVLFGYCTGAAFQNSITALQAHTDSKDSAVVIGTRNMCRTIGGSVGTSVSAVITAGALKAMLPEDLKYLAKSNLARPDMSHLSMQQQAEYLGASVGGIKRVFMVATVVMGLCFLSSLFVIDNGLDTQESKEGQQDVESAYVTPSSRSESSLETEKQVAGGFTPLQLSATLEARVDSLTLEQPPCSYLGWSEESKRAFSPQKRLMEACSSHSRF